MFWKIQVNSNTDNILSFFNTIIYFEEMKNTLIHNCIGSHTYCFMSLLGQSSVTTNFEKALHKIKSQIILE